MLKKIDYVLTGQQKRNIVILSLIIIVGSLMELLGVSLIGPLTTVATDEAIITTDKKYILLGRILGLRTVREYVLTIVAILILIYLVKNLYLCFMYWCQYRYQYRNEERLALEVMDYYVSRDYLFHVSKNVADIQRNVASDVASFWSAVFTITSIFNESLVCIILMIYLLVADVVSTVCVGLLVGISLIAFYFIFKRYSFRLGARLRIIAAERTKWLLQIFGGIKEIKVTEKDSFFIRKYKGTYDDYVKYQHQQSMLSSISKPIMETVCIGGLLGIVAVRVYAGVEIKTFIPTLAVFAVAAFRMLPSFNRLSTYLSQLMSYKAAVESVYSDIVKLRCEERTREKNGEETEDISETEIGIETDIYINHITFQYPSAGNKVLNELTMVVPYKKSVALIGTSGAGKTTLADVILGILIPQEGEIISGNINVLEHLSQWHKKIGYIPQTIYLMDDTIRNNIAFGVDERDIDDKRVKEVLEEAQLSEFVCELPDGVNTMVGDRGVRLSGGQRQRIGIARALYTNPQLLILDEATSALDNETETAVMEAIDSLQGSCTMIIIAHRLTTIKNCDVIYEIENGKAVLKDKREIFDECL